jgi:hemoglobin
MRVSAVTLLAGLAVLLAGGAGRSAPQAPSPGAGPLDRKDLDRAVYQALTDVMNEAADLYNGGGAAASAALYRGALLAVEPLLGHRPDLQRAVRQGLADAQRFPDAGRRAWALHYVAARARTDVQPMEPVVGTGATLWERLGGQHNVARIIDAFVNAVVHDPKVNFTRGGRFPMTPHRLAHVKAQLLRLASAVSGGPHPYDGRNVKAVHAGMGITDAEFDELLKHLRIALFSHRVKPPDADALVGMVDSVRSRIVEPAGAPGRSPAPAAREGATVWERLGGEAGVTRLVGDFVDAALKDPRVNLTRNGQFLQTPDQVAQFKRHLVHLASAVGEGPHPYRGRSMKQAHAGMRITDAEFDELLKHLRIALARHGARPADTALILKAADVTRKDVVESGGMPAPVGAGADARPAPAMGSSPAGSLLLWLAGFAGTGPGPGTAAKGPGAARGAGGTAGARDDSFALANRYNSLGIQRAGEGRRAEAEEFYQKALALYERLAVESPAVAQYRVGAEGSRINLAHQFAAKGGAEDALALYDRAVTALRAVLDHSPQDTTARLYLRNAHWGRGLALTTLGRHADAVADYGRAAELTDGAGRAPFAARHAVALARAGDHTRAAAEVDALADAPGLPAGALYNLAGACAIAAGGGGASAERRADRAVALLRQAVAKGYKDVAHLRTDADWDPLRRRADFQTLLRELEEKAAGRP